MEKKKDLTAVIISVIALVLSAISCFTVVSNKAAEGRDVQYVMFVGTNDKDTNQPVCSEAEAKKMIEDILVRHFGGYTIQEAEGGWKDGEKLYEEHSFMIYLSDTDLESVHAAADELIEAFNQSSVLIQANETKTEFYAG